MKIGIAQINTIVGDLSGNQERITHAYHTLVAQGADLVLFPELVITGYPPRDLLFKNRFVPDNLAILESIAAGTGQVPAVIGFVGKNPQPKGRRFLNAAAWCADGAIQHTSAKCLLPTYDVFDEDRYFAAGTEPLVIEWQGKRIGITVCEDIWTGPIVETSRHYAIDPLAQLATANIDLLLNLSASPWHYEKNATRLAIVSQAAQRVQAPTVYCNAIGGNDELIFDGHSIVVDAQGRLITRLKPFSEDLQVIDLSASPVSVIPERDELGDIYHALVLGLRDYAHKSGFRKAILGLSGGIDSALTAALAVEALGNENVIGISLPSAISSDHSKNDAAQLADNLAIAYHPVPIENIVTAAEVTLAPLFQGTTRDVTEENIQARTRGLILMALSNKYGALLLTTGNKSEVAVGYCTLYGDMAGGLGVISDLPKTKVFELCRWINANSDREIIPENTITKPPSAELRPDQKDEDSLPPYDILDEILRRYVQEGETRQQIADATQFDRSVIDDVVRKVDLNEYKRKQAAPGLKITPLAFGVGRRIPLVQKYVD